MRLITVICLAFVLAPASFAAHHAPASWVHGWFATCVRNAESHNGADPNAHGNLYGVQDSSGHYGWAQGVSRAEQDWIAWKLYLKYGVWPWKPYDGCG